MHFLPSLAQSALLTLQEYIGLLSFRWDMALQIGDTEASDPIFVCVFVFFSFTFHFYTVNSSLISGFVFLRKSYFYWTQCPKRRENKHYILQSGYKEIQKFYSSWAILLGWQLLAAAYFMSAEEVRESSGDRAAAEGINSFSTEFSVYVVLCYRNKPVNE